MPSQSGDYYVNIIAQTKDAINNLVKLGAKVAVAIAVFKTLQKGIEAAINASKLSAEFNSVHRAFSNMATKVGQNSDKILASLKEASAGTISQLDLIKSASKAALFGLPMEQMDKLMAIARASATATGQSMSKMFDDIVTGIARGSPMILDNLGLSLKIGEATEAWATSIGKTTEELTAEERKMAILNATLEAGAIMLDKVGDAATETTDLQRWEKMQAAVADLKLAFGGLVSNALMPVVEWLTKIVQGISDGAAAFRGFTENIKKLNELREMERKTLAYMNAGPAVEFTVRETILKKTEEMVALTKLREAMMKSQKLDPFFAGLAKSKFNNDPGQVARQISQLALEIANLETGLISLAGAPSVIASVTATAVKDSWGAVRTAALDAMDDISAVRQEYLENLNEEQIMLGDIIKTSLLLGQVGMDMWTDPIPALDVLIKKEQTLADLREQEWKDLVKMGYMAGITAETNAGLRQAAPGGGESAYSQFYGGGQGEKFADYARESMKGMADVIGGADKAMTPLVDKTMMMGNMWAQMAGTAVGFVKTLFEGGEAGEAMMQMIQKVVVSIAAAMAAVATAEAMINPLRAKDAVAWTILGASVAAMAQGGIVTRPTMALIGERGPEAVVPLNRAGGMGTTININAGSVIAERSLRNMVLGMSRGR